MNEHEAYVRAAWQEVYDNGYTVRLLGTGILGGADFDKAPMFVGSIGRWKAAYEFTIAREEEIRKLEEETFALYKLCPCRRGSMDCVCEQLNRTQKRLEAITADLKRDMKVPATGASEEKKR